MSLLDHLKRARAGDTDSAELLARELSTLLARLVAKRIGPSLRKRMESDDLVQEIYLRFLMDLPRASFASAREFHSWVFSLTYRCMRDLRRGIEAEKRNPDLEQRTPTEGSVVQACQPRASQWARAAELEEDLEAAMLELPRRFTQKSDRQSWSSGERYLCALYLKQYLRLSDEESARILGKSTKAFDQLHRRAQRKLRRILRSRRPGDSAFDTRLYPDH